MRVDMIRGSMAAPEAMMHIMSDYHRSGGSGRRGSSTGGSSARNGASGWQAEPNEKRAVAAV